MKPTTGDVPAGKLRPTAGGAAQEQLRQRRHRCRGLPRGDLALPDLMQILFHGRKSGKSSAYEGVGTQRRAAFPRKDAWCTLCSTGTGRRRGRLRRCRPSTRAASRSTRHFRRRRPRDPGQPRDGHPRRVAALGREEPRRLIAAQRVPCMMRISAAKMPAMTRGPAIQSGRTSPTANNSPLYCE